MQTDDLVLGCAWCGDSVDADWPAAALPVPASASFPDCVHLKSICILFTAHFPSSDHGRLFLSLQPRVTTRWEQGGERCLVHDVLLKATWESSTSSPRLNQDRGCQFTASAQAPPFGHFINWQLYCSITACAFSALLHLKHAHLQSDQSAEPEFLSCQQLQRVLLRRQKQKHCVSSVSKKMYNSFLTSSGAKLQPRTRSLSPCSPHVCMYSFMFFFQGCCGSVKKHWY